GLYLPSFSVYTNIVAILVIAEAEARPGASSASCGCERCTVLNVEPRVESNVQPLVATSGRIESSWLCGSRADGATEASADWDLVLFGTRSAVAALEGECNFLGQDVDRRFVDVGSGEFKRLWTPDAWEEFAPWHWIELSAGEAQ